MRFVVACLLVLLSLVPVQAQIPPPATFGEQTVLAIMVNFTPGDEPYNADKVRAALQRVSDFYVSNSYGQTSLTSTVTGWYTIPSNLANCDIIGVGNAAQAAAVNAGIDLTQYHRYVYFISGMFGCASGALTSDGGSTTPSQTWIFNDTTYNINTDGTNAVLAHELGHAFGLLHAHQLICSGPLVYPYNASCTFYEYGDKNDVMSVANFEELAAPHRFRLGWLGTGTSPGVINVTTSGMYHIDPLVGLSPGPKALKIVRQNGSILFVEYRVGVGVFVHITDVTTLDQNVVAWMGAGGSFNDTQFDLIRIQVLATTQLGATFSVTMGTPPPPPPTLTVAASLDHQSYHRGQTAKLTVRVVEDGTPILTAVTLTVTGPNPTLVLRSTTDSQGRIVFTVPLTTKGTWTFSTTATVGTLSGTNRVSTIVN